MYILTVEDICQYFSEILPTHLTVSFIKRNVTKKMIIYVITVKHLISAVSNFRGLTKMMCGRILIFGVYNLLWLHVVKKIAFKFVTFFLNFLLNYTLCHLLESPPRGDFIGMP